MPKPFESASSMLPTRLFKERPSTAVVKDPRDKSQPTAFHMLVPDATVIRSTLTRSFKPWIRADFPNSSLTSNVQPDQGCASHPMSIVSMGPICSIVLRTPSDTGVIPVVPEVNCSQLKSPVFEPAVPPPGVFPGVSGIVNC